VADHELKEHAEAEAVTKELENTDEGDPQFDTLVRRLIEDIRHHFDDEESDLLPKLREACDGTELVELGKKFERAKRWHRPARTYQRLASRRPTRSWGPVSESSTACATR
jgi:Hemerythrin HHE cation binding domain